MASEEPPKAPEETPKISKRAAEKAAKKAEKAKKKAETKVENVPLRPKSDAKPAQPANMFAEGWLKKVYEEKPVPVRTRFPPEPNGFLHIGHAKAITVNFGFAEYHGGVCFLRFDDTNPEKEDEIFFTSIIDMVKWLGFKPYQITYSSDNFDRLYELAEELIRRDKAYVCHCSQEETNNQRGGPDNRGKRYGCAHRDRPVEESLTEFRAMRDGKYEPREAFLRMKQKLTDPSEGNPQMWDLPAYRIVKASHPRTGSKWRIYPTYDFTHCLCDAFEEISHSLCTTEFYLSRTSYDWLCEALDFKTPGSEAKGPMQREYGRLNVSGTILSKRRIQMLVEGSLKHNILPAVRGWDDPRLYTLVGIRRRGVPPEALKTFISELGVTDALTNIEVSRFEQTVRRHLEQTAPRLSLILDPIPVTIEGLPEDYATELKIPFHPKKPDGDVRTVTLTRKIYIDRSDFVEEDDPNFFRLAPEKTVGLLNAPFMIRCTGFTKSESGAVESIQAVKVEGGDKPKAYIHWVDAAASAPATARVYNALFLSDEPNGLDWKEGGWVKALNPHSEVVYENAVIEKAGLEQLTKVEKGEMVRFQGLRTGYFSVDEKDSEARGKVVLNQIVSLKEDTSKTR